MNDIYLWKNDFEPSVVIDKINQIAETIENETSEEKMTKERYKELMYAQFIQGLKLSTRNNIF